VPGAASSDDPWGELPLVVDTSAWSRAHHVVVRDRWVNALLADRLRLSPAVKLEVLLTARSGEAFDVLAEELAFRSVWLAPPGSLP
jgi:predicted nucleic acid-binding protein